MNAQRLNKLLLGLLLLLILATVGMLGFSNILMQRNANKLVEAKLNNISYDSEEQSYLQARKDLEQYASLNEIMQKILPKSKDQAQAVSELYKIGDETGIVVQNIQFPSSNLGQKSSSSGSTKTVTQAKAVDGMPGVMGIDITVQLAPVSGDSISYDNMISFLQKAELNRRSMQIKQITVYANTEGSGVTFDITLTIFVKPWN